MENSNQSVNSQPSSQLELELAALIAKAITSLAKRIDSGEETIKKLIAKPGVIFNFFDNLFNDAAQPGEKIFVPALISGLQPIVIEALDGRATIAGSRRTFRSGIDERFGWWIDKPGCPTPEASLDVFEIAENVKHLQAFQSVAFDLDKLVMSQHQIIRFCEQHPYWLRQEGYPTMFLIKESIAENKGSYFVVEVRIRQSGLNAELFTFEDNCECRGELLNRLVCPQRSAF